MTLDAAITLENHEFFVSGNLNFKTVMGVLKQSWPLFDKEPKIILNFSRLQNANSAAIALVFEWIKYAKKRNKTLLLNAFPQQLTGIVNMSGLSQLMSPYLTS